MLSALGAGGMGEVYRATDTRLDRTVALKVLPEDFFEDKERVARFEREAKLLAALSHPNIAAIYSFEEIPGVPGSSGRHVLAQELLEGATLRQRLAAGPLPLRKAVDWGVQIARGLAAAHEKGIVHRDLKPENLFVTTDGHLKILDFGLARQMALPAGEDTKSPTVAKATDPGTLLGTVGYMAPEQVRGQPADARSDIFSFGCVLYEMLTGQRAFKGDSAIETMNAILKEEPPDPDVSGAKIPPDLDRLIRHCLEKSPAERFQSARDLAFDLESVGGSGRSPGALPAGRTRARAGRRMLVPAGLLLALVAGVVLGRRFAQAPQPSFRMVTFHRGYIESARFSSDGQTVVYGSSRANEPMRVYASRLGGIESRTLELPSADVVGISRSGEMALLLNRRRFGFRVTFGTLARAALAGGSPREILENVCDADISPDGSAFAVVRSRGTSQVLEYPIGRVLFETPGWVSHPRISLDGKSVAFFEHPSYGDNGGFVAVVESPGKARRLTSRYFSAQGLAWSRDGSSILFTAGDLAENCLLREVVSGRPPRVVYRPPVDLRLHDISRTGVVLLTADYDRGEVAGFLKGDMRERDPTTWSDEYLTGISADGSVLSGTEQSTYGGADSLAYYRRADSPAPVLLGPAFANGVSPDGKWTVTQGILGPFTRVTLVPNGPGESRDVDLGKVETYQGGYRFTSWSADGRLFVILGHEEGQPPRAWLVDAASGGPPRAVTPDGTVRALLSPDGRSVAAVDAAGQTWIHPVAGGQPLRVPGLEAGEIAEQWDASGLGLFVWNRTFPARIHRVDIKSGQRRFVREIMPTDPTGVLYGQLFLAQDGTHYAYRFRRILSQLYTGEGLQ
ncbi:MAG: protein kinase domain-containing protein [Thermoanaerobaculia bacterium]